MTNLNAPRLKKALEELILMGDVEPGPVNEKGEQIWRISKQGLLRWREENPTAPWPKPANPGNPGSVG